MNRYRTLGQLDDASINEGDTSLVGINSYDSPENLEPGQCQAATNMDFTSQDAKTRGGLVCLPELGKAPFGRNWYGSSLLFANDWNAIAYGNNVFVAIATGTANGVGVSADGVNWRQVGLPDSKNYLAITYGNGLFVAVAASTALNGIVTSPDGITWTQRTSPANYTWVSVAYGNGVFVAGALFVDGGAIMTSPDGITWTLRTPSVVHTWQGIVYGNGLFVAVALGASTTSVMTSPDGITWTTRTTPAVGSYSVAYGTVNGSPTFVAVGTSLTAHGDSMVSNDGITWTQTTPTSTAVVDWRSVSFGDGIFMAVLGSVSAGSKAMFSSDGITWTDSITPNTTGLWHGIAYGNGIFVAVGNGSAAGLYAMLSTPSMSVFASGNYSDPNSTAKPWIVLAGYVTAGFFSFGQTSRTIKYPVGYSITSQSTIVQANNLLFIFSGSGQSPIQWDGTWGGSFVVCPVSTLGVGYENIPFSNQGTYYQNRLWVVNGKDSVDASQNLDFANFNLLTGAFNLNVGSSDYVVCSYPFGNNSLVVFKNRSSYLLQNVDGALTDVTSTEITRQIGIIGINAVTAAGPDIIYMSSDRNITSIRLNIQNDTQAVTVPLSRNINPIMRRVNWTYGYKVSMGYWNNLLFVALPLDQATACNTIIVYNLITNQWYGEWTFDAALNMDVQGFVTANYLGQIRMHAVTEDGRIFVVNEGQNDISGTTVAEISTSLTTRAYPANNENRFTRRLYLDLSTNRPNFSVTAYVEGASESTQELTNQTYSRSNSWLFSDTAYDLTNANDDYNRAFRQDYSTGPASVQCGMGFQPEMNQDFRLPLITRRNGRLQWLKITNSTGFISINSVGFESRDGYRSSLTQVG